MSSTQSPRPSSICDHVVHAVAEAIIDLAEAVIGLAEALIGM
jgi:hypothetical protein